MTTHISPQPAPPGAPAHLTQQQLAARWACTTETLSRWSRTKPGFPTPIRIGRRLLYRVADVLAYEERQLEGPTDAE